MQKLSRFSKFRGGRGARGPSTEPKGGLFSNVQTDDLLFRSSVGDQGDLLHTEEIFLISHSSDPDFRLRLRLCFRVRLLLLRL